MATGGRPGPCLTPDWKPTAAGIKLQVTVRKKKKKATGCPILCISNLDASTSWSSCFLEDDDVFCQLGSLTVQIAGNRVSVPVCWILILCLSLAALVACCF